MVFRAGSGQRGAGGTGFTLGLLIFGKWCLALLISNNPLKDIQWIGNLSNRSTFESEEKRRPKVFFGALQKSLGTARSRFERVAEAGENDFRL
tara:strand:+ start:6549 stop:6827 length:279 start_codon:yes stop_codon:yes gene_type:complete